VLHIRHIDGDRVHTIDAAGLDAALAGPGFVWLDFEGPTPDEDELLNDARLGLHPLVIEDMVADRHLPKVDVYGDQLLLTVHALSPRGSTVEVVTVEMDVALKAGLLVTYHTHPVGGVGKVRERLDRDGGSDATHPMRLLWRILDVMNDVFVPFLEFIERRLDLVEEDILTEPTEDTRREIYGLQRDVIQLRRIVVPQAEVIRRLARERPELLEPTDHELLKDVYDHLYRMAELSDSYRQLLDSAMDSYRSALNDDLNDMLKVLTLFSAVLLPISMLAGIYGMNFRHMPELAVRWAYPAVWSVFVLIVAGELAWFRSRGWIGRRAEKQAHQRRVAVLHDVLEIPVLGEVLRMPAYGARAVVHTGRALARVPGGFLRRVANAAPPPNGPQDRELSDD